MVTVAAVLLLRYTYFYLLKALIKKDTLHLEAYFHNNEYQDESANFLTHLTLKSKSQTKVQDSGL